MMISMLAPFFSNTSQDDTPQKSPTRGRTSSSLSNLDSPPTTGDIFLGRGTLHARHPGNSRFYQVIDGFLDHYEKALCKIEKTEIIKVIYDKVTASGQRFLKEDSSGSGICTEAPEDESKKKIGHTLRYRQKRRRLKSRSSSSSSEFAQAQSSKKQQRQVKSNPVPMVTPLASPILRANQNIAIQGIFSDDELESVLGFPGQLDISEEPSRFFLQSHKKTILPLEELGLG
eukprot:scaffold6679_cov144-Amphora_coffeaeformis.AAC.1